MANVEDYLKKAEDYSQKAEKELDWYLGHKADGDLRKNLLLANVYASLATYFMSRANYEAVQPPARKGH